MFVCVPLETFCGLLTHLQREDKLHNVATDVTITLLLLLAHMTDHTSSNEQF